MKRKTEIDLLILSIVICASVKIARVDVSAINIKQKQKIIYLSFQ